MPLPEHASVRGAGCSGRTAARSRKRWRLPVLLTKPDTQAALSDVCHRMPCRQLARPEEAAVGTVRAALRRQAGHATVGWHRGTAQPSRHQFTSFGTL